MNLVNELIKGLLPEEEKQQTTALYAGGFKPPTSGHFEVVEQALKQNPEIDEFIIFVGAKERDGISQDESMLIWDIYKQYLPLKVKIEPTSIAPIKAVYDFAKNHPTREVLWIIGAREGNEEDFKDITSRTKSITNYPNIELRTIVTKGGASGTAARNASKVSLEKFVDFLPSQLTDEEKQRVYDLVSNKIQELNENASYSQHIDYKQKIKDLTKHMLDKGMNILPLPKVRFIHGDSSNASQFLGKTAYYNPNNQEIVLYTEGRHPKDIVRSFSHEMIHHIQNLEDRLGNIQTTNTQEDDSLNDIEAEANLKGTMIFRNWTDSLNEGIISLTPEEESSLRQLVPIIIKGIKDRNVNTILTSPIEYTMASGEKATFRPYIYYDKNDTNSAAHFRKEDAKDFNDNLIGVNYNYYGPAFDGTLEKIWSTFTGDSPKENLLSSLRHELIHAKDPAANNHELKAKYDATDPASYYGGWTEFPTQTGEFFEILKNRTYDTFNDSENTSKTAQELKFYFQDILDFYSGKTKSFDYKTWKWISGGQGNAIQRFIKGIASFGGGFLSPGWEQENLLKMFATKIALVKQYNPEGYKEFQKDLYKLIQKLINKINSQIHKNAQISAGGTGSFKNLKEDMLLANLKGTMTFRNWTDSLNEEILIKEEDQLMAEVVNPDGERFEYKESNIKGLFTYKDSYNNLYFARILYQQTSSPYFEFKVGWFEDNDLSKPKYEPQLPPNVTGMDNLKRRNTIAKIYRDEILPYFKSKSSLSNTLIILPISDLRYTFSKRLIQNYTPDQFEVQYDDKNQKFIKIIFKDVKESKSKDPFGINAYAMELARLREDEEQPWKIYLDMDGVLADFDQHFKDLSGMEPREFEDKYGKNAFWDFIDEGDNKIRFWAGIPVMDGAKQLVDFAKNYDYELLTAPSNKKQSLIGKSVWVKKHIGDLFPTKPKVNFKKAKNKHLIKPELTKYDILVDDRASTIDNWNNAGGTGILYKNINQTLSDLKKLGL